MDLLKFKFEKSGVLVASTSANRSIVYEENAIDLVSPYVKRSKYYNPYAQTPCHDKCVNGISKVLITRKKIIFKSKNILGLKGLGYHGH
ncbi:hypothetical protein NPIL_488511 [Nephila pilipes]|uniref:Uncharacterized protein n=1 Tax=Nephila pilipes TaxID=299642 RepID=A0A8X6PRA4_NEPPI|nr:hypothetical protein NPIL_488511 [Nephila pilipes]